METLHAPWRIQYIVGPKRPKSEVSLFSEIAQSGDDLGNHVIGRGRSCFAMLNAYPYAGGHLMVVPYRQVMDWEGLEDGEVLELMRWVGRCQRALTRVMRPEGFNVGVNLGRVAGAGVAEHLHIHVVPRWSGDTNFMPVLAETAVVSEGLRETAAKLREALSAEK